MNERTEWSRIRRRILTPSDAATSLEVRGFFRKDAAAQELIESVGKYFLTGYGHAAEARSGHEVERMLEAVPDRFKGFAYEGAAMAFAVRDGLPLGGSSFVADFLAGRARAHIYMAYVGVGWAMARLPRFRWPGYDDFDPLLRWLVIDGLGFHQAFFRTRRYVHQQHLPARSGWSRDPQASYSKHAFDQGIGRALWFVGGTDPRVVAATVNRFPARRRADLFSGVGLAATYAGGVDARELHTLVELAGHHRAELAQGSAFAAEARFKAGLIGPHTQVGTEVLCGMPAEDAARLTQDLRPRDASPSQSEQPPAYEVWRQRLADELVALGGVGK